MLTLLTVKTLQKCCFDCMYIVILLVNLVIHVIETSSCLLIHRLVRLLKNNPANLFSVQRNCANTTNKPPCHSQ